MHIRVPFLAAVLACAAPLFAVTVDDYKALQQWRFSDPVPLTSPVTIARDTATWTLESGAVRLMEPASDGTVTGVVFEGQGRFTMTIPDRYELAQLRRFTGKRELAQIDVAFTQLVLRTSDGAIAKQFPAATGAYAPVSLASKRHELWIERLRRDTDALVVAAMLNGMTALAIDVKTEELDWLLYEYDAWRAEEISLSKMREGAREIWLSLDRKEDRQPDGRPGRAHDPAALVHVDVKADLTKRSYTGGTSRHGQHHVNGEYLVDATYTANAGPLRALRLDLFASARELNVRDANGKELPVLRDHVGKRSASIDNRYHDDDLVVLLPSPINRGEKVTLQFAYVWESANYAPGGAWYPMVADTMLRPHTARLELTVHKKNEARAMGRLEKRTESDKSETTVWVIDRPAKMVTFSTATRFEEVKLTPEGIPPVIAFGPSFQFDNRDKVHNVGADVANSMQWLQNLLGEPLDVPQFYVTSIASSHGQAFDGFLHMGEFTFSSEHPGASELFRAHEVAHEWFGHKVGWASYRDQWLSESLAEYSAMMFVQSFVKGGERHMKEILLSYDGILRGLPFAGGFSKFNRPALAKMNLNLAERGRVGPIAHGYRANTSELPGYYLQAYFKGPMVLHMLRTILGLKTGGDDLFVSILRDYVKLAKGKDATTDDFRRIIEQRAGGDWRPFFDSWIYGAEIPSYTWNYKVQPAGEGFEVALSLQRRDVSPEFMTIIPVKVEFGGGKRGYVFVVNRQDQQTMTFKVPQKPVDVVFAPEHSLLGAVRRD